MTTKRRIVNTQPTQQFKERYISAGMRRKVIVWLYYQSLLTKDNPSRSIDEIAQGIKVRYPTAAMICRALYNHKHLSVDTSVVEVPYKRRGRWGDEQSVITNKKHSMYRLSKEGETYAFRLWKNAEKFNIDTDEYELNLIEHGIFDTLDF